MFNKKEIPAGQLYLVNLGCAKNQVDAEQALGVLVEQGFHICYEPEQADIIIVNTCAFIQSAEEETVQAVLEASKLKKQKKIKVLIVAGCVVSKHEEKRLLKLFPEIDSLVPPNQLKQLLEIVVQKWSGYYNQLVPQLKVSTPSKRVLLSGKGMAYLKITEGCSRKCSFCLIPFLRGPLRSRPVNDIVAEAQQLVTSGSKELVIVAQDTTAYGSDHADRTSLVTLLKCLVKIKGLKWLRLMYLNPDGLTDKLLEFIASEAKICNYLDMPLQHASATVLKRMHRHGGSRSFLALLRKIRAVIPDVVIRTTLLSGFPGETEEDHQELMGFVGQARFDRMGAFSFSREKSTVAAEMAKQVHFSTKQRRLRELMQLQEKISSEKLKEKVGRNVTCLIEEPSGEEHVLGRTCWDAPEIDGTIILKGQVPPGQMVRAKINGSTDHDLYGEIL